MPLADTVELQPKDVVSKVAASANIDSREVVALTTTLTSAVTQLDVTLGQPVQEGQIVARLDTSGAERELASQRAQQASAQVASSNEIERAQQQLNQQQEALGLGLNPQVTAAEAAQRDANVQLEAANAAFEQRRREVDAGLDPQLAQQEAAVEQARGNVSAAGFASVRANATNFISALTAQIDQITPVLGILEADESYKAAQHNLDSAQRAYEIALHGVDADLEAKQREVAAAFQAKNNADVALEVARLAAQHQVQSSAAGVEQARRSAEAADNAASVGQGQLIVDIASGEVRSPINGVVTNIVAQRGQPAAGHLLTVANPEQLKLTANVNETDSGRVQVGNEVTFTTPGTGTKQFRGRVSEVSPVAVPIPAGAAGAGQAPPRPEFPVTIEVVGDKEGLRIGSSAKVQITTSTSKDALTVPREAVIDSNGKYSVLVLRPTGEAGDQFEVAEVPVSLGLVTDLEAEVHGVEQGARVLRSPGDYREKVGQVVRLGQDGQAPVAGTSSEEPSASASPSPSASTTVGSQ
ncbi:efflux RND transporter periplasmic adaptor subunit [Corynebacterium aquatimens]|uniref:efflux RND transporter periplasmic adaptor subunit n=1 Tax=Corynebacterium aquatimens TaxID=1190508 RepID=UPI002540CCE3|nr:efflux RND transporter periplasmic adaptor subunit [Corynebacterium aquatimens]QYH20265.1 efflux RND transporter periplasmic adaptor subunit [Corynebacterium aquatimens]